MFGFWYIRRNCILQEIEPEILIIRGRRVALYMELATIYRVATNYPMHSPNTVRLGHQISFAIRGPFTGPYTQTHRIGKRMNRKA